ncbi:hypothetical protein [Alteribacillus sp. HJP-4]|uniref:hypothetical protein n=1 Tax=Alteribacillus sp. HJP-4 TaxID=2775394 RepID=UPI0035CD0A50
MWIYFDELDGYLHPKWMFVQAYTADAVVFYSINQPFERLLPEDFHDDIHSLSVDISEMVRHSEKPDKFGIHLEKVQERLQKDGLHPDHIFEVDYFIMLCEDVAEIMAVDLKSKFNTK